MIMTILNRIRAWSSACRGWSALAVAISALAGGAWLAAVLSGSADSNHGEFRYVPLASPVPEAAASADSGQARHPLDDALDWVQPSVKALRNVKDYTAVFTKTELIHGRLLTQKMDMKFRQKPFSVYFHGHSKRN